MTGITQPCYPGIRRRSEKDNTTLLALYRRRRSENFEKDNTTLLSREKEEE